MSFPERLLTPRLIAERHVPEHGPELAPLLQDPRVARTLAPGGRPPTHAELEQSLTVKLEHWERFGFGLWLLRDRATGGMVGRGGLQHTLITGTDEVEVGWSIIPARWGQGLATEMALAAIQAGFDHLPIDSIIAYTLGGNQASRRVMEKAGMKPERELQHTGGAHILYRRRRC